jgi:two-component system sensor histidine kinase MtrB
MLATGRSWRGSLAFRVVTITLLGGLLSLGVTGAVITAEIRDRLFNDRLSAILQQAADRVDEANSTLSASIASTPSEAQNEGGDIVGIIARSQGVLGSALVRDEAATGPSILQPSAGNADTTLITAEMHDAVRQGAPLNWQSVVVTVDGEQHPGVVVGAHVDMPVAGDYELYIFYSLQSEQQMLSVVTSVLGLAGLALVVMVLGLTILVLRWVLRPVRQASRTAERLAAGLLDERMDVRGSDEVARLGESFNEMADSLQQQIKDMSDLSHLQQRFVSDVSHELRTPMTTIRMAADLLYDQRESFTPPLRRSAELLLTQIERFDHMLADLLEISRFDAGAAVLEAGPTDLAELSRNVIDAHQLLADSKGATVTLHRVTASCTAEVDARRIERVIRNFVVNAIEHSEGRGVDVSVAADDRSAAVLVRDHGVGMTPTNAQRVFDRFWRGDSARTRTTGGTGLGLSIAAEDVRLHGGTIDADGRPGEGAAFLMTVPIEEGEPVGPSPLELWPDHDDQATAPAVGAGRARAGSQDEAEEAER